MSFLKDASVKEVIDTLDEIKKRNIDRNKQIMENTTKFGKRVGGGWNKSKTMKHVFSIPEVVYMANRPYWDEIIKTKQWKKHPEFMTEN